MKTDLPTMATAADIYAARLQQSKAKQRLFAARRDLEVATAEAYIGADSDKHFERKHAVAVDEEVGIAQQAYDEAEIAAYEAWAYTSYLMMLYYGEQSQEDEEEAYWNNVKQQLINKHEGKAIAMPV